MQPRSDSLFHFTKSLDFLKGILHHGFKPRYSLEDSDLFGVEYTGFPMCCFCDIPISRIFEHTAFYGDYGIGMTREWGRRNFLHPVLYMVPGAIVAEALKALFDLSNEEKRDSTKVRSMKLDYVGLFFRMTPYVKPVAGKMRVAGEIIEKDFSQENEWRFVPKDHDLLFADGFDEKKVQKNEEAAKHPIKFTPNDVRYIFVKQDHEIPSMFDFIQTNLGHFPMNDVKILTSRIVSLETLSRDL